MNDKNITYFRETVKKGSLTKAARSLSISQPALSMGLNALEKKLGYRLLNRQTAPVSLTEEGMIYLKYIDRLDKLETDFAKQIRDSLKGTERRVVIGAPLVYAETILTDFIGKGLVDADYRIKVGSQSELAELLESAQIDCYISTSDEIGTDLQKKVIAREKIDLCIPKSLGIAADRGYKELDGLPFVLLEEDQPLQKRIERFFERCNIRPLRRYVCDQVSTCISLALKGKCLCFASPEALQSKNIGEQFVRMSLPDDLFARDIYLVYDERNFISQACKEVIENI